MWIETPPAEREKLAVPQSAELRSRHGFSQVQAPELTNALGVFSALSRTPALLTAAQLANACAEVAIWAEERALGETSLQFAEAAATLEAETASRSLLAARVCRRAGEYERASAWYERTIEMAGGRKNVDAYIRANLGMAALLYHLGEWRKAAPHLMRAAERAVSRNRRGLAAEAHHDLLFLAEASDNYAEAELHVRAALDWYPITHDRLPNLLFDFGFILTVHGLHETALRVLRLVVPVVQRPADQVAALGNLARAAGIARDRFTFEDAKERIVRMAPVFDEYAPAAYFNVAVGAHALRQWDDAERFAATALNTARSQNDGHVANVALPLLDVVSVRQPFTPPPPPAGHHADAIVREMLLRLERWTKARNSTRRGTR